MVCQECGAVIEVSYDASGGKERLVGLLGGRMDFEYLSNEEGIDRRQALAMMWDKFYEENRAFIESLPKGHSAVFFADMVVQNMPRFQWLYDGQREARYTPIPARVWFNEHKGICPTCGLDMNGLLGKEDFSVVPHLNGTCKE